MVDLALPVIVAVAALIGIDGVDVLLFLLTVAFVIASTKLPEEMYTSTRDLTQGPSDYPLATDTVYSRDHGREGESDEGSQEEEEEEGEEEEEDEEGEGTFHSYHLSHHGSKSKAKKTERRMHQHKETSHGRLHHRQPQREQEQYPPDHVEEAAKRTLRKKLELRRKFAFVLLVASPFLQLGGIVFIKYLRTHHGSLMNLVDPSLFFVLSLLRLLFLLQRVGVESNTAIQMQLANTKHTITSLQAQVARVMEDTEATANELRIMRTELSALRRNVEVCE